MAAFRILLAVFWLVIAGYTAVTVSNHGWNLFPFFFGDIAKMGWAGQFNVDFLTMLGMSALWVAWRNRFSAGGLALSVLAFFGGGLFLTTYLLVLTNGDRDMKAVLLGDDRAVA